MLFRLFSLIALIGAIGPDTTVSENPEDQRVGGEGFGNVVMIAVLLGMVVLAAVVIIAVLSVTGQFESDVLDPRT